MRTTAVLCLSWSRSGQLTRLSSPRTSLTNFLGPAMKPCLVLLLSFSPRPWWPRASCPSIYSPDFERQEQRRDSNPRPAVLETAALPTELLPSA